MASSISLSSRRNLWDPYQVLDIYPNSRNSSCVGLAKTTGRRCRWSFYSQQYSDSQIATAVRQLDSMAAVHPSDVTPAELHSLARNTLCRDFHQGQAYDVEREWRATIDAFVRENGEMLALAGEVRQLAIDIKREREVAETDVREARQALEASQGRCSGLVEKNDRLAGEHAASSRDFALLRRQLAELQTDAKSRDDLDSKVEQLKRLTDERHANFEKYAAARSNEMKALRESKARLDGMMTTSTMELSSLKRQVQALDARAERSEEEANDLRQKLEASGREIASLQEAKASFEKNADLREQEAERTRQDLRDSNARHEALETRRSHDSKHLSERFEALEQKYAERKDENIEQDRKIGQLDDKVQALDARAKMSEEENEDLRQELRTCNDRLDALETRSSDDSNRLVERLEALKQRYAESKDENIEQDRKIGQLVERMDAMRQEFQESKDKNLAHTSQLREQDLAMRQLVEQMGVLNRALIEREENLSSSQPQKRSLFAKISRQPPRVLVRKISRIMTAESTPYVQSAA